MGDGARGGHWRALAGLVEHLVARRLAPEVLRPVVERRAPAEARLGGRVGVDLGAATASWCSISTVVMAMMTMMASTMGMVKTRVGRCGLTSRWPCRRRCAPGHTRRRGHPRWRCRSRSAARARPPARRRRRARSRGSASGGGRNAQPAASSTSGQRLPCVITGSACVRGTATSRRVTHRADGGQAGVLDDVVHCLQRVPVETDAS